MDPRHFVSELICLTMSGSIIVVAQVIGTLIAREEKKFGHVKRGRKPRRMVVIPKSEIDELRDRGIQQHIIIPASEIHNIRRHVR